MLGWLELFIMILCLIHESSTEYSVTVGRDYSYMRHNEVLAIHMKKVLDRMAALKVAIHPRIQYLYELLMKDIDSHRPRTFAERHNAYDLLYSRPTPRSGYSANKLIRVYTTETDRT